MYSKYKIVLSISVISGQIIHYFIMSLKSTSAVDVPRRDALNCTFNKCHRVGSD